MKHLFITGLHRSGTTLVEKVLLNHPQIFVASQPSPFLFYNTKQFFLDNIKVSRQYPLDHLFGETEYNNEDFQAFLKTQNLDRDFLKQVFEKMKNYEGHWTKEILKISNQIQPGIFLDVFKQVCDLSYSLFEKKEVKYIGSKEIMCEEFMPYMVREGVKVVCIIRDPRDMVASTNTGTEMGEVRPTLFYLRNWRKSVALSILLKDHPNFYFTTFEKLVGNPVLESNNIAKFLDVNPYEFDVSKISLNDQHKRTWKSNSSFQSIEGISSEPIGRYKNSLTSDAIKFIETFCYPEMKLLGYQTAYITKGNYSVDLLNILEEPFEIKRKDFAPDYSTNDSNIHNEKIRVNYLTNEVELNDSDIDTYFINKETYNALKFRIK